MAVIAFPDIKPEIQTFGIKYNTQVSSSELNGSIQSVELPGARWAGSLSYRDMTIAESSELKAFLLRLRGSAGRFYYGDASRTTSLGNPTGTITVTGGTRTVPIVSGLSGNFAVGDYIQIGSGETRELKMIIVAAGSSLTVEPPIRMQTYTNSQPVTYVNPTGVFMLSSSDQAKWAIRSKAQLSDISLDFVEGS